MKNVLVTGGAGFIGSAFVRRLLLARPDVRVVDLDALTYAGSPKNLENLPDPDRHVFVQGDIRDAPLVEGLFRDHAIDTVVHFAAESHVDRSIHGPDAFVRTNVNGTLVLLEAARVAWEGREDVRFHHASTDEVYGSLDAGEPPADESAPYRPSSPYSASKAASDHLVRAWGRTWGLPVTITLSANNLGPRQFPEKLVPVVILNALAGAPLPIYGDGRQVREWLHVDDNCDAVLAVLERGRPGESYNVSTGVPVENLAMVRRICAALDRRRPAGAPHERLITHVADRRGHDRRYALDPSKVRRETGWAPAHSFEAAVEETVDWYLDNVAWVDEIRGAATYRAWVERNYRDRR